VTTLPIASLDGAHSGESLYIIAKGPSLEHLRYHHIGIGPVMALNSAIAHVETLGLSNVVYSIQKDGCDYEGMAKPTCDGCPGVRPPMAVMMNPTTVYIAQVPRSSSCFPNHPLRYEFTPADVGYSHGGGMSILIALELARRFGVAEVVLVSADSVAIGECARNYDPIGFESPDFDHTKDYAWLAPHVIYSLDVLSSFHGITHRFVTPTMLD